MMVDVIAVLVILVFVMTGYRNGLLSALSLMLAMVVSCLGGLAAQQVFADKEVDHALCVRTVKSGEPLTYYFGSCWSKGDLKTAQDWFNVVNKQK